METSLIIALASPIVSLIGIFLTYKQFVKKLNANSEELEQKHLHEMKLLESNHEKSINTLEQNHKYQLELLEKQNELHLAKIEQELEISSKSREQDVIMNLAGSFFESDQMQDELMKQISKSFSKSS